MPVKPRQLTQIRFFSSSAMMGLNVSTVCSALGHLVWIYFATMSADCTLSCIRSRSQKKNMFLHLKMEDTGH